MQNAVAALCLNAPAQAMHAFQHKQVLCCSAFTASCAHLCCLTQDKVCFADSGRMTWLLEMDGYSPRNSPPFSVTKQSIGILQNHYPERLGWAILSRPPCIFSILWRAINPFLDQDTRDKVVMIKSGSDVVKSLKGVINASAIDQTMGGTRNGHYDFAAYQERMSKLESEKL